jgi:WD40 repeat protein/class 3 adenylate cyclase
METAAPASGAVQVGSERTFLIADVRGYTRFTREHGDAAAARLASAFAQLARDSVEACGGQVIELRGDEALAVFPWPLPAVRASIDLVAVCEEEAAADPTLPLRVGVGIDVGEAVPVEGGFRGAALNTAARLCSKAEGGQVLVSPRILERTAEISWLRFASRGRAELKGFEEPVELFEPTLGEGSARTVAMRQLDVPAIALPLELEQETPLVGRARELSWLRGLWRQARRGYGRVILLTGPSQSGKTRLAAQIASFAVNDGASVTYVGAGSTSVTLAITAVEEASHARTPTLVVLDDIEALDEAVAGRIAARRDALETASSLVLVLARDVAALPEVASMVEESDGSVDTHRRLVPLTMDEIRMVARLYAGDDADDAPLESIERASGGLPGRVHELMSAWAEKEAARRLAAAAEWIATEHRARRESLDFANNVIALKLARLYGAEASPEHRTALICPYKGLASFEETDSQFFFGRERLVGELAARTVGTGFLAVVGASGSGKSSLIAAGLVPSLAAGLLPGSERWQVTSLRPGEHPLGELERAEAESAPADRRVLVVDQFEELFTICATEEERATFVEALTQRARLEPEDFGVVVSLRGDFVDQCARYQALAELLSANQVLVGPMTDDELRRAIELPARRVGIRIERALIETLVEETSGEPGALPLLSTALVQLWQERTNEWLRMETYQRTGGVRGAVARLAEATYQQLSDTERGAARHIFLRLVAGGEGEGVTRRRTPLREFDVTSDGTTAVVLSRLTEDRLLTQSDGMVEVAHEALLREWPRFQEWLAQDAQGRALRQHLRQAAQHWDERGRDSADLYRGTRLSTTAEWASTRMDELNELERSFLGASRRAADRSIRRLRIGVVTLAVLLLAAIAAGTFALVQRAQARHSATVSLGNSLGAQAVSEPRLDLAMLLGRAAVSVDPSLRTRSDLLTALLRAPTAERSYHLNGNRNGGVWVSPNGRYLAIEDNNGNSVVEDAVSGRRLAALHADIVTFGPDGELLTAPSGTNTGLPNRIQVRDPSSLTVRRTIWFPRSLRSRHPTVAGASFAEKASHLAVELAASRSTDRGPVTTWAGIVQYRYRDGRVDGPPIKLPTDVASFGYLQQGRRLIFTSSRGTTIIDARTGKQIRSYPIGGPAAFSPDGKTVALAGAYGAVRFLDLRTGKVALGIGSQAAGVVPMGFTPDGKTLITSGEDGKTLLWDVKSHAVRATLTGHAGPIHAQAISADGSSLYTGSFDSNVLRWDLTGRRGFVPSFVAGQTDPSVDTWSLALSPDSRTIAVGSTSGTVSLWNVQTLRKIKSFSAVPGAVAALAFSPDGGSLMVAGDNLPPPGAWLRIWKVSGQPRLVRRLRDTARFGALTWATWSRNGERIAATGVLSTQNHNHEGVAQEWNARTGRLLAAPTVIKGGYPTDVAFAPNDTTVAVGAFNGAITILDPARRVVLRRFSRGGLYTFGVAYSPDGSKLASTDWNGSVDIWDAHTGKLIGTPIPDPDQSSVQSVAWSPDGRTIAFTDSLGTLRLLDVASRVEIGSPVQLDDAGQSPYVAFTPDSTHVVVSDDTARTWVFPLTLTSWENAACRLANRNLTRSEWSKNVPGRSYRRLCPGSAAP